MSSEQPEYFEILQSAKKAQLDVEEYEKKAVGFRRTGDNISLAGILISIVQVNGHIATMYKKAANYANDEEKKNKFIRLSQVYASFRDLAERELSTLDPTPTPLE